MHLDKPTTRCKGNKTIWGKIWEKKEHKRKAKWINSMKKIAITQRRF